MGSGLRWEAQPTAYHPPELHRVHCRRWRSLQPHSAAPAQSAVGMMSAVRMMSAVGMMGAGGDWQGGWQGGLWGNWHHRRQDGANLTCPPKPKPPNTPVCTPSRGGWADGRAPPTCHGFSAVSERLMTHGRS